MNIEKNKKSGRIHCGAKCVQTLHRQGYASLINHSNEHPTPPPPRIIHYAFSLARVAADLQPPCSSPQSFTASRREGESSEFSTPPTPTLFLPPPPPPSPPTPLASRPRAQKHTSPSLGVEAKKVIMTHEVAAFFFFFLMAKHGA